MRRPVLRALPIPILLAAALFLARRGGRRLRLLRHHGLRRSGWRRGRDWRRGRRSHDRRGRRGREWGWRWCVEPPQRNRAVMTHSRRDHILAITARTEGEAPRPFRRRRGSELVRVEA